MTSLKSEFRLFLAEAVGTALLLFFGLSFVIFNWGEGSIVAKTIPSEAARKLLTGFLFGTVGCLVTISPVGKISGAHINPAVSIAFWLRGKMKTGVMIGYIISQMIGAILGCLPLLLWGKQGSSIQFGITKPGETGIVDAFVGEVLVTSCLIFYLYMFIGSKKLRNYTPFGIPVLYSLLTWAEASYSGCSTNPARSFGPALVSRIFSGYWLYWIAPLVGVLITTAIFRIRRLHHVYHMHAARVSYHSSPTPDSLKSGFYDEQKKSD
jgi:aquaporin Z